MFYKSSPNDYKAVLPGIELKTLVFGDKTHSRLPLSVSATMQNR